MNPIVSSASKIFPCLGFHNSLVSELESGNREKRNSKVVPLGDPLVHIAEVSDLYTSDLIDRESNRTYCLRAACIEFENTKESNVDSLFNVTRPANTPGSKGIKRNSHNRGICCVHRKEFVKRNKLGVVVASKVVVKASIYIDLEALKSESDEIDLPERTLLVAREFLAGYRALMRAIRFEVSRGYGLYGEDEVIVDFESSDSVDFAESPFKHPTQADVCRLVCSYKSIASVISQAASVAKIDVPSSFKEWCTLSKELDSIFMTEYLRIWSEDKRVCPKVAITKTWEHFCSFHAITKSS